MKAISRRILRRMRANENKRARRLAERRRGSVYEPPPPLRQLYNTDAEAYMRYTTRPINGRGK